MARPYKMGLDYFTVDTDIDSDPKIMDLIQEGDTDAWTVYSWSLIKIFRESYYIEKDTLIRAIAWTFRNLSKDRIRECLDMMAEVKLIDREFYRQNIVTGKGIQKRYWMVAKNRTALPNMDYWLLDPSEETENYQTEKRSYDGSKPSYQGSKPSFQGSKSTKEKEKEKEERRKGKPASVSGGTAGSKKPPAGMPDRTCPICKGTGWVISENNEAHRCECIRR